MSSIEKSVATLLRDQTKTDAVLFVRRELKLGLADAVSFVDDVRDQFFYRRETPGMSIHFFGAGPFSKSIASFLEYPETMYAKTSEGDRVCVSTLECYEKPLTIISPICAAFGIADPSDINQHVIDNVNVDFFALRKSLDLWATLDDVLDDEWNNWIEEEVTSFETLMNANFRFYLRVDDWAVDAVKYVPKENVEWD